MYDYPVGVRVKGAENYDEAERLVQEFLKANPNETITVLPKALVIEQGEHLMVDNPYGDDECCLCGHDQQDLPERCDRGHAG